ncbi:helix-turn-helix transcriptional regulator [Colwellia sp. E2M01]|uniref:helix-turn-helix domain-containing protein n=1 Tax=Colwellia sp. E2M01 TaxID=2841561 RepID=UPI001C09B71D|nr:helix-turn-helix domain-containing protein [Colwellia sp. E2M01]
MNKNKQQIDFGLAVRTQRNRKKLTQEELAHLCNLDRTYIGSVERGERNVSLLNIHKIAFALEINIKELF